MQNLAGILPVLQAGLSLGKKTSVLNAGLSPACGSDLFKRIYKAFYMYVCTDAFTKLTAVQFLEDSH